VNSLTRVESIIKNAIYTKRIGFITLSIEEVEPGEAYEIYTVTEKQGKQFVNSTCSLTEAYLIAEEEEQDIEKRIARKRKGKPTMRQLATLFDMKIPIPLNLTFGQASDLIDERIERNREKKRAKIHLVGV
jgi:capsule polysaccharide export protein KpsE/RkpR